MTFFCFAGMLAGVDSASGDMSMREERRGRFLASVPRYLRVAGLAFALGLLGICVGLAGYAAGWYWLQLAGFGLGVLAMLVGTASVLMGYAHAWRQIRRPRRPPD